jgi:TM2 domain-containing membrane protein YozV
MRIGNVEREEAAQALAEHFSHGRIDGEEYEERIALVWAGKTTEDLAPLFGDLPGPHPTVLLRAEPQAGQGPPSGSALTAYGPPAGLGHPGPTGHEGYGGPSGPPTYGAAGLPAPGQTYGAPGLPMARYPAYGPDAPFGREAGTGAPYSDKSKVAAGLLQIFLGGVGAGRFYTGHAGIAVAQLIVTLVTFGLGAVWGVVDGIVMLASRSTDSRGRPLRP